MARYTDIDKLIAEYDRVHVGPAGGARKLMVEAPIADVAPRAEVAREIFGEIEKILNDERINRKLAERGFLFVRHGEPTFEQRFAELKKKYAEGQK